MSKVLAIILLYVGGFFLSIQTSIHGWGLEPQNWWWIILGPISVLVLFAIANKLSEDL